MTLYHAVPWQFVAIGLLPVFILGLVWVVRWWRKNGER